MTALAFALVAAAMLVVSGRAVAVLRLRAVLPPAGRPRHGGGWRAACRRRLPSVGVRGTACLSACGGLAVGSAAGGPVVGVAGGVALGAVSVLLHHASSVRWRARELDRMTEALAALTAELRAGRTPADALRVAAAEVAGDVARRQGAGHRSGVAGGLLLAAATAAVGGDVPAALRHTAGAGPPDLAGLFSRLAAGWQVSVRSGASLAAVLALVEHDARARSRHARQVAAELAGPRATAALLAVLPCVGLALGTAMGAHPLAELLHTRGGQLSLLAGVLLDVAGTAWTLRLVGTGARP
jgi:tight adherence protein B